MYCRNCGKELSDEAVVCPACGTLTGNVTVVASNNKKTNTIAIVGFILSFFVAIAGLICSIIGYKKVPECGGDGKGLAIAGIVISAVWIFLVIIYLFAV